jgi:hypothetical protein
MKLSYGNERFVAICSFAERHLPKDAGFRWDAVAKVWFTKSRGVAAQLSHFADDKAKINLAKDFIAENFTGRIPAKKELMPFQIDIAVPWALAKKKSFLALDAGCIVGDAEIAVNRNGGSRRMKLSTLFEKFNGLAGKWDKNIETKMSSVDGNGHLRLNTVKQVLFKGRKKVIEITAKRKGKVYKLKCTPDHEILTPDGWKAAGKLIPKRSVIKTNGLSFCEVCKKHTDHSTYKYSQSYGKCKTCHKSLVRSTDHVGLDRDGYRLIYSGVKFHPRSGKKYVYEHILIYEAYVNGLTLTQWLDCIRFNDLENKFTVPSTHAIHHKNEIKTDNRICNLELMTHAEHMKHHARIGNIPHMIVGDAEVISVKKAGEAEVYDIVMCDPLRNFIANGVAVHNCGKTACAFTWLNALDIPAVYICPPFLVRNTEVEKAKWYMGTKPILVVPDSMLTKKETLKSIEAFKRKHKDVALIVDEAHRYKNPQAKRTKRLFKLIAPMFKRELYLSGTPMISRPIEMFTVLDHAAPETIGHMNYWEYGVKYCNGFEGQWGWDFSGASNLRELTTNITKSFMLRLKKEDVLKELPPKIENTIFIGNGKPRKFEALEKQILKDHLPEQLSDVIGNTHLSTYRKEIGSEKAVAAIPYISLVLENPEESLLIFGIHKEALAILASELKEFQPLVITGDTLMGDRHELVKEFQTNPEKRVMILNVQAGGVGLTLTKATRVVFLEAPWTPSEISQAEDRNHRIGKVGTTLVDFLVYENSLDAYVLNSVLSKRKIIDKL